MTAKNYKRLKRIWTLIKKSGRVLLRQGPVLLSRKVILYVKGMHEFRRDRRDFAFTSQPTGKGINIVGYLGAETGLGESVRTLVKSVKTTNLNHALINHKLYWLKDRDKRFEKEFTRSNPYNINVIVLNPEGLELAIPVLRDEFFDNRYNIGYWVWELPDVPTEWKKYEKYFDEFWVPSEFVRQAMIKKINKPVFVIPHSIEIKPFKNYGRSRFGIKNQFLLSFIFDYNSLWERKNPAAVVRSFKKAFHKIENVALIIKCSDPALFRGQHNLLLREINQDERIKIISKRLTRDEIYSLLDVSDAYVSLHRSEGFGLTIAEAMFLGKPVICTNYSGNLDFTNTDNSLLVDYKKMKIIRDVGPYKKGDEWAEAEIDQAAGFMRELYEKKELRDAMGCRGKEYIHNRLNPASIGERIVERVEQINLCFSSEDAVVFQSDEASGG